MCMLMNAGSKSLPGKLRLPRTVIPKSYELKITPNLDAATFEGEVFIDVDVNTPVSEVVLNALDLKIHSAHITNAQGTSFEATTWLCEDLQQASLRLNGQLGKGEWRLHLVFSGTLNDKLRGFYRSRYKDESGQEQILASTQFEATDARRAFPCFDEPDFKATFKVSLVVDAHLSAISNTRIITNQYLGNGRKQVDFAPTMKMSTYIVAFVVGKLVATKPINVDGFDIRCWCIPGKEHLTRFSLETAAFALRYFQGYFGRAYPGDKIDLLAIPDFAMGAMENLGCITFRETALLVDPAHASQKALERVADVVSHELAHMWFGDLVTMGWWNGIWLNEAFATFMAAKAVDAWKKTWDVWGKFAPDRVAAMQVDALGATRSVEFPVNHPDEASAMFDVLTYQKGCSIMRMLEQDLGEETFRQGIALYMQRHAYGNTEGRDLWAALETVSGQPVGKIMHNWIFAPGFPELSVSKGNVAGSITITQKPCKFLPEAVDKNQLWIIPVFIRAQTAKGIIESKHRLEAREQTIYLGEELEWAIVNAGAHSFVRVNYSADLADSLGKSALPHMSNAERFCLLSDAWAGVMNGTRTATEFLSLAELFKQESNHGVWACISGPLQRMCKILPADCQGTFAQTTQELLGSAYAAAVTRKDNELQGALAPVLAICGNSLSVVSWAKSAFEAYKKDHKSLDPNLILPALQICAYFGDAALYEEIYGLYKGAKTPQEERYFLDALSRFQSPELIVKTLEHAVNPESIRTQNASDLIGNLLESRAGAVSTWEFVKNNWRKLEQLYPESGWMSMCESVQALDTEALEKDVLAFLGTQDLKSAKQGVTQALELLRVNVLFRMHEQIRLAKHFACGKSADKV